MEGYDCEKNQKSQIEFINLQSHRRVDGDLQFYCHR